MDDQVVVLPSARRHGLSEPDVLHAYRNPIRVVDLEDGLTMMIGPDRAGLLLEVGVSRADGLTYIVHAMKARHRFMEG